MIILGMRVEVSSGYGTDRLPSDTGPSGNFKQPNQSLLPDPVPFAILASLVSSFP